MNALRAALVLFVAVLLLALVGEYRYDPVAFRAEPLEQLYRAIQLFTIEMDWADVRPLPWELDVARFLAPLVTIAGLVLVFVRDARVAFSNATIRLRRDHVVVVGLNALGLHFARSCQRAGLRAVAIDRDADNPNVERCRRIGVPVVVGDALRLQTLERAGLVRASHLVTFVRDDGTNVELTLRAKSIGAERADGRAPLRVRCHLSSVVLASRLEAYPKFFLDPQLAEIAFFNVQGLAARTLLRNHPFEVYADALRREDVHVVVFGDSALADAVVLQAARVGHYASFRPPAITVCAPQADVCRARLAQISPGLVAAARLEFVDMALAPDVLEGVAADLPIRAATAYVVCLEDESAALSLALGIRRSTLLGRGLNAPVMVAMGRSDGLARLLESELGTPEIPDGLYPFGMFDEIVGAETIVDERLDRLAQAFHEDYLEGVGGVEDGRKRRSRQPWTSLPEVYRTDNRLLADHLDAKLRAVRCREVDSVGRGPTFSFSDAEIERIAHMEHDRFLAVRRSTGWRVGVTHSDFARLDANLQSWAQLDAAGRSFDLRNARDIPAILEKRLGHGVRREVVIGVTGHRLHRLNGSTRALTTAIERTLRHIGEQHARAEFVVLSSLAEGADRLIARSALDILGARLHVPLALPYELYVEDFGGTAALGREASIREFHDLLGRAERYFEMSLEFGNYESLSRDDASAQLARARQYALAGAYIVQRSHELVAVWDGHAQAGEGGTAQVVAWRSEGVPDAYRFPDAFFPPVAPTAPFVIPPDAGADFVPRRLAPA